MKLVDGRWRLFGIINIFDLFVLCIIAFLIFFSFKWTMIAEDPSFIKSETVHVKCKGVMAVPNYMADSIKEGDAMLDASGNVICKIEKVLSVVPAAQIVYQSKDGEKIFSSSTQVNVTVLFDLTVYKRQNDIYFENLGSMVVRGGPITMKSEKYKVVIVITEILNKP